MKNAVHVAFLHTALTHLPRDDRIVGIAADGSWISRSQNITTAN